VEALIERIRKARGIGVDLHEVHDTIMASKDPPTEGEFYLAWKAAEILDAADPSPNG
jgi:hypothetical protein